MFSHVVYQADQIGSTECACTYMYIFYTEKIFYPSYHTVLSIALHMTELSLQQQKEIMKMLKKIPNQAWHRHKDKLGIRTI